MKRRDFRIWSLPETAQKLPSELIELETGNTLEVVLEGGLETAEIVMNIVNDALDASGVKKSIMCFQDGPFSSSPKSASEKITFKAVAI